MIKKNPHKNMYKQRLHVKKNLKKFLNSIKLFLSVPKFSTEYRDVAYVQYRDVQVPRCPDTILSDNFKSDTLFKSDETLVSDLQ